MRKIHVFEIRAEKVRLAKTGTIELGSKVRLFLPPRIPDLDALL
jgi:hypothetical protein